MKQDNTDKTLIKLIRFCGEESFLIKNAEWCFNRNEEENISELWLNIQTENYGYQQCEDTKGYRAKPFWKLAIRLVNSKKCDLNNGFKVEVRDGCGEDNFTNFYYYDHDQTDNNFIEIIEKKENLLLIRLRGERCDVNYYDGSKAKNLIFVETWFKETPNMENPL